MQKILIVKTSSLGDIVHGFSVLPYLKELGAEVHWIVEEPFKELAENHPMIDRVFAINTKKWRKNLFSRETWKEFKAAIYQIKKEKYDVIFDIQGNLKSALFTFLSRGKAKVGFSFKSSPEWPAAWAVQYRFSPPEGRNIRQDYLFLFQSYYRDYKYSLEFAKPSLLNLDIETKDEIDHYILFLPTEGKKLMLISPSSTWRNKELRPESLESFLKILKDDNEFYYIFSWGANEEKKIAYRLQRAFPEISSVFDKRPLHVFQYLISKVDMVIAMDSLPLHLCGMTNTPSYSFFGASSYLKYKPVGKLHGAEQGECPYGKTFEKRCPILRSCKTGLCIRGFSGDYLYESFKKFREQLKSCQPSI